MADTKISALTAVTSLTTASELVLNEGGTSKKVTVAQLRDLIRNSVVNGNGATQSTGLSADTYVTNSGLLIPTGRIQVGTFARWTLNVNKTSVAGVATPIINVRVGTLGTTSDTSRAALTFAAQTAVADEGFIQVIAFYKAAGASASVQAIGNLTHRLAATGLSTSNASAVQNAGSTHDVTGAGLIIGISINLGTSFTGSINLNVAELVNLS
jgi:hypothetical protein